MGRLSTHPRQTRVCGVWAGLPCIEHLSPRRPPQPGHWARWDCRWPSALWSVLIDLGANFGWGNASGI